MNIARVAAKLLEKAENGKNISEQDVIYIYRLVTRNEDINLEDMNQHVVGRTLAGKAIMPKTKGQLAFVKAMQEKPIVFAIGPAGTGKTYLAVIQAVTALKKGDVKRIVLTRPAVEAGENLGFLPGDLKEKVDPYLTPLYDALRVCLGNEKTEVLIEKGTIEIAPLAYMRGRTLDDCYVILDEAQNTTTSQMKMFLTRLGFNSKMIITGDITQIDLEHKIKSGLEEASAILKGIDDIAEMYKYNIVLANSDEDDDKEVSVVNNLFSKQVDGIIFMGYHLTEKIRSEFSRSRTPVVLAGTVDVEHQLPSVNIDYKQATVDAVTQLAKHNKKIAFVSGPLVDDINGKIRLTGYKEALKAKKLSYSEGLVFESKYRYDEGYNLAERIIASKATAAFVTGDELAAGLLNGLSDKGIKVPEDFEIITSDDSQVTRYTRPNLSTIGQPLYDLGAISMRMLTKIMHKEELEEREVLLSHTINQRGTTKK